MHFFLHSKAKAECLSGSLQRQHGQSNPTQNKTLMHQVISTASSGTPTNIFIYSIQTFINMHAEAYNLMELFAFLLPGISKPQKCIIIFGKYDYRVYNAILLVALFFMHINKCKQKVLNLKTEHYICCSNMTASRLDFLWRLKDGHIARSM